jgi:hypothetical protein
MLLQLTRKWFSDNSTIGELRVNGEFECYTLEDPEREEKIPGETAIPGGKYEVIINHSQRFNKDLPLLLNVPQFEGIRIHVGNYPKDTDGCILVGQTRDTDFIGNSRVAFNELFEKLKAALQTEEVFIEITHG